MHRNFTLVISTYLQRSSYNLNTLTNNLFKTNCNLIVIINDDYCRESEVHQGKVLTIRRPNRGMNIGAWSAAIPHCSPDSDVIFLQDECEILSSKFFERYSILFSDSSIGMIGESLNTKWDINWRLLRTSSLNYPVTVDNGVSVLATNRVDLYLSCLRNWNIDPGNSGLHLRSLVWAFRHDVLKKVGRFPEGRNKEECIAAEIGISRLVKQLGYRFVQSDQTPFRFIYHPEWEHHGNCKRRQ